MFSDYINNLYYYENPCFLCKGYGLIGIKYKPIKYIPPPKSCPLCEGKRYLKIKKGDYKL